MSQRPRIILAKFLIRFGRFLQSLALMVMKPKDLVQFSKTTYSEIDRVQDWSHDKLVDSGLNLREKKLIQMVPLQEGKLLILGVGGGREAIPLSQLGFKVTGLDFIPALVHNSIEKAKKHGITLEGLVQDISDLSLSSDTYHIIWMSQGMYSSVPTRLRRIRMLKRLHESLHPGGFFICQFNYNFYGRVNSVFIESIRKLVAILSFGNLRYEKGDTLWGNIEFSHVFNSKEELEEEFAQTDFNLIELVFEDGRGGAILQKSLFPGKQSPIERFE